MIIHALVVVSFGVNVMYDDDDDDDDGKGEMTQECNSKNLLKAHERACMYFR